MLLAPKAAGLGLTITAANYVIHLERWWNPAVVIKLRTLYFCRLGRERQL